MQERAVSSALNALQPAEVRKLVRSDRKLTISKTTEQDGISYCTMRSFYRKIWKPNVSHSNSAIDFQHRLSVADSFLKCSRTNENFVKSIVTGDETRVYGNDYQKIRFFE
jgi:hypothetical protein